MNLLRASQAQQHGAQETLLQQAQFLQQAQRQAEELDRRQRHPEEEAGAEGSPDTPVVADGDDIGGGVDALDDEDGEFNAAEARATLAYLENQHSVLQEQRQQVGSSSS